MKKKETEKRMYVLVPYNLSEIQKGIQALHAVAEYSLEFNSTFIKGKEYYCKDSLYVDWAKNWKTVIVLNGGTTGKNSSMHQYRQDLLNLNVDHSLFHEPDLNDALTGIAFIVDMERDTHIIGYLKSMDLA